MNKEFFIGLDIGTDSVGYAVTDTEYNLLKHKGEPMWGSTVFEAAKTKAERRSFRTARRRLHRRKQRILLTQEIFVKEIAKVDEKFFIRIKESGLYREDTSINSKYFLFEDGYTDQDYHKEYPTIHHLIRDLMNSKEAKDVRLVYIATAWLMAHRGHFLNEVDKKNISAVLDFEIVYRNFEAYCIENFGTKLWECSLNDFKEKMLLKVSVTRKEKEFFELLNGGKKFKDTEADYVSKAAVIKLLSGGQIKAEKVFKNSEYSEVASVGLGMPEEDFGNIVSELGDDGDFLLKLRALYDWGLLAEILNNHKNISSAKVEIYEQHKRDLKLLKYVVKKYIPEKYDLFFRENQKDTYVAYVGKQGIEKCNKEAFCSFLSKQLKNIVVLQEDKELFEGMISRIESRKFMPKQVDGDNRVIPYQLYWDELNQILTSASQYLPFLNETDKDGYKNTDKLLSIFEFRIPYYVGPLRTDNSDNAWMKRKEGAIGKIYPWNFNEMVDLDASEQEFINRMTNQCSYLPGEDVIPKCSLLYQKFMVLNEINNIKVNNIPISVEAKHKIYSKFKQYKKMSQKKISDVLQSNNWMNKGDILSGIDQNIKSSLASYHVFKRILENGILTEQDVEEVIKYRTYSEDKQRMKIWLSEKYPQLSDQDKKYILNQKFKDFGRLSKKLLLNISGACKETGEIFTIMDALWNTNDNLMQLLSSRYTFFEVIEKERKVYYQGHEETIDEILDSMYVSNSAKRPIYRTLAILSDIKKATQSTPKRIFIEMARGGGKEKKRTISRRDKISELYSNMNKEEVRELSHLLDSRSDNELQSEVLFLYFMQMGKCMYSGERIDIEQLKTSKYNVDHIYPQSKVKDDSFNNKVLVLSQLNSDKGDRLVPEDYRRKMSGEWLRLYRNGMMSEEKYKRLMRTTPFSEEELQGFINRQLVETRQSTKALANILQRLYPDTEIVYVKAGIVSDYRKEFTLLKSRVVNDLHHGKDAYLNIVCGNVYHCRFTKNFVFNKSYSLKIKTIFTHDVYEGKQKVWHGEESIAKINKIMQKNNLHYVRFSFERKGGLFDQMPVKKGNGAVPRKANLPIEKYGGYNKSTATFFLLVKYQEKKKVDMIVMPVDLYMAKNILENEETAKLYAQQNIANILGKEKSEIKNISFPLGLRKIKINTCLSLDGFCVVIRSKANKGTKVIISSMESLVIGLKNEMYVKKLENFDAKKSKKVLQSIDSTYDGITLEKNLELYQILRNKLQSYKYDTMFGGNAEYLSKSLEKFKNFSLEEQVEVLLNIISIFKTGRSTGCDLSEIGGKQNSAIKSLSSKMSNWKKQFTDVRIIDTSASGIYKTQSCNLLELF